jgi:hypothetical protein
MDKYGNIGGASTLHEHNQHRGAPHFPITYWREGMDISEHRILQADNAGNMV